jgi:hypothetical protein
VFFLFVELFLRTIHRCVMLANLSYEFIHAYSQSYFYFTHNYSDFGHVSLDFCVRFYGFNVFNERPPSVIFLARAISSTNTPLSIPPIIHVYLVKPSPMSRQCYCASSRCVTNLSGCLSATVARLYSMCYQYIRLVASQCYCAFTPSAIKLSNW